MWKNLWRPASWALYLLSLLDFFLLGLFIAGATGAGKGQGLAAGAIVLSYGVVAAILALFTAIGIAYGLSTQWMKRINYGLLVLLVVLIGGLWVMSR